LQVLDLQNVALFSALS